LSFPNAAGPGDVSSADEGPARGRSFAILAVDDEPEIAQMIAQMLRPLGHRTVVATSGEAALERLSAEPFDIVISDIRMEGGMSGWELATRVQEDFPSVRMILATGWATDANARDQDAHGVEAVISKPFEIEALEAAVLGVKAAD
jgi:CheY-like chemotaxis protein